MLNVNYEFHKHLPHTVDHANSARINDAVKFHLLFIIKYC